MGNSFVMNASHSLTGGQFKKTSFGTSSLSSNEIKQITQEYDEIYDYEMDVINDVKQVEDGVTFTGFYQDQFKNNKFLKYLFTYGLNEYGDDILKLIPKLGKISIIRKPIGTTLTKVLLSLASGDGPNILPSMFETGGKSLAKESVKTLQKKVNKDVKDLASEKGVELGKKGIQHFAPVHKSFSIGDKITLAKKGVETKEYNWFTKKGTFIHQIAKFDLGEFGMGIGVDYVFSMTFNVFGGMIFEGQDLKTALAESEPGSTLLTSVWKTGCSIAFENMFTFAGPGGRKFGRFVGTVVGSFVGDTISEKMFDNDQGWCAAAGVGAAVGAGVSGVVVASLIAAGTIAVSVPVAGWIIGGVIIAGLAVGTFVVWVAKLIADNWENIKQFFINVGDCISVAWEATTEFISNTWEVTTEFVSNAWKETTEFVSNVWEGTTEFVSNAWEGTTEFVSNAWKETTEFVSNVWEDTTDFFSGSWYNPLTWSW